MAEFALILREGGKHSPLAGDERGHSILGAWYYGRLHVDLSALDLERPDSMVAEANDLDKPTEGAHSVAAVSTDARFSGTCTMFSESGARFRSSLLL